MRARFKDWCWFIEFCWTHAWLRPTPLSTRKEMNVTAIFVTNALMHGHSWAAGSEEEGIWLVIPMHQLNEARRLWPKAELMLRQGAPLPPPPWWERWL